MVSKKKLKFKNLKEFISSVLKNSKILATAGLITIGAQTINAQEVMKLVAITPSIYGAGHSIHSTTMPLNLSSKENSFLLQSFEYRYGKDFNIKNFAEGRLNLGLAIGSNNLLFNNKLVTDKLFEQINLGVQLSKILGKDLTFKIGFDKKLNNYVLRDLNLSKATKGTNIHSSLNTKKLGTGITLNFSDGKLKSYDGIQEVRFSNKFTGTLRLKNSTNQNLKKAYYEIGGLVDMSKKGSYVFMPMLNLGLDKAKLKAKKPNLGFGVLFKPLKKGNKFTAFAQIGLNTKDGKWVGFSKISYAIGQKKKPTPKVIPKPRSKLLPKKKLK